MAGRGGGYTIPMSLARKLETEGRRSFQSPEHGTMTIKTCNRCSGSGRYSFNLLHQDRCYGCSGTGVVAVVGTEEDLAQKEAKNARARERAAERKREKAEQAKAEEVRILAALGLTQPPIFRGRPSLITSRFEEDCAFCRETVPTGSEIVIGDRRGIYHPGCFGDRLLQDIADTRPHEYPEGVDLPF